MYGVLRFIDNELVPATAPDDYPKIIKSGIDEEGQHPKSPPIAAVYGLVTLLHRVGRPDLLERLLDVKGTKDFTLQTHTGSDSMQNVYLRRSGYDVEAGFMSSEGLEADHGVRFIIVEDENSPYRFGKWIPLSTSDNGSAWGGSPEWVRAQSAAIAKAIWWHRHWDYRLSISYTGITDTEKDDFERFMQGRLAQLEEEEAREEEIHQRELAKFSGDSDKAEREWVTRKYNESLMRCKADCGEMSPTLQCTKCKFTRYCSVACQKEDWKYHKMYCGAGTELLIPEMPKY